MTTRRWQQQLNLRCFKRPLPSMATVFRWHAMPVRNSNARTACTSTFARQPAPNSGSTAVQNTENSIHVSEHRKYHSCFRTHSILTSFDHNCVLSLPHIHGLPRVRTQKTPFTFQNTLNSNFVRPQMWPAPTKCVLRRWGRRELQANKWGTLTMSSHLIVLPGADTSYRQTNEGQSRCPPLDCPTWGRHKLQAKKSGIFTVSSTWMSYLGPMRATAKQVRDTHYVLPLDCPTWGRCELQPNKWGTCTHYVLPLDCTS